MKKILIVLIILTSFVFANRNVMYYKRAFKGIPPRTLLQNLGNPSPSELREDFNDIKKLKMTLKNSCLQEAKKEIKSIYNLSKGNSVNAANYIIGAYYMALDIPISYSEKEKRDWNVVKKKFIEMKIRLCLTNRIRWHYVKAHKKDILDLLIGIQNGIIPPGLLR